MSDSVFQLLRTLCERTKIVRVAHGDDVVETTPKWSDRQKLVKEELRGLPEGGYRVGTKEGAKFQDFEIRRLTSLERETANRILDAVPPKEKLEQRPAGPGLPPQMVRVGFDDEDPAYLAERRYAECDQQAFIVLKGVVGLEKDIEGEDDKEKMKTLRKTLDHRMLLYLAAEIWGMSFAGGDPADFFTSANS